MNTAVSPRRDLAVIVTDTLQVHPGGAPAGHRSKCVLIPHAGVAVGSAGASGIGRDLAAAALAGALGGSLPAFIEHAPGFLRSIWRGADWRYAARVLLAGRWDKATVAVYVLDSGTDFEPVELGPGCYFNPPLGCGPAPPGAIALPAPSRDAIPPAAAMQTARESVCWRDALRAVVDAVPRQQREASTAIGGSVVRTFIAPDYIEQRLVAHLPEWSA
jgi:hypothetical protein